MIQIVQTPSGQHILAPVSSAASSVINGPTTTSSGTTILSNGTSSTVTKATSTTLQLPESSAVTAGKPVMRVSPVAQVQQSSGMCEFYWKDDGIFILHLLPSQMKIYCHKYAFQ